MVVEAIITVIILGFFAAVLMAFSLTATTLTLELPNSGFYNVGEDVIIPAQGSYPTGNVYQIGQNETLIVGDDIPEGIYYIDITSGNGTLKMTELEYHDDINDKVGAPGNSGGGFIGYDNFTLNEGAKVVTEGFTMSMRQYTLPQEESYYFEEIMMMDKEKVCMIDFEVVDCQDLKNYDKLNAEIEQQMAEDKAYIRENIPPFLLKFYEKNQNLFNEWLEYQNKVFEEEYKAEFNNIEELKKEIGVDTYE